MKGKLPNNLFRGAVSGLAFYELRKFIFGSRHFYDLKLMAGFYHLCDQLAATEYNS